MRKNNIPTFILLILAFVISSCGSNNSSEVKEIILDENWVFACNDSTNYREANVPGSVFTDLMQHEIIEDPFLKSNENDCQWVAQQKWTYQTNFDIDAKSLKNYKNLNLHFGGIDTYADIYLNDSLILQCDNAFRPWEMDIKSIAKTENNILKIVFKPIEEILEKETQRYNFTLPEGLRVYARKPQFHFGWDWAPKLLNISIFKAPKLVFWNDVVLEDVSVTNSSFDEDMGFVTAKIFTKLSDIQSLEAQLIVEDVSSNKLWYKKKITLSENPTEIEFQYPNPKIWSIENPNYYDLRFTIYTSKKHKQSVTKRIGFRNVKLRQDVDSVGSQFYFELNGEAVFSKGSNWVPADVFQHRISAETYRDLLILAKDAGHNMIRIWGGGFYEDDSFYEICDSLGIMVWQDFMFACSMYPFYDEYMESVRAEANYQLRRLSSHPSIVLWCGNNENTEGWFNWGWQRDLGYSLSDSAVVWDGNHKIFYEMLPQLCSVYNNTDYHASSPLHGWGREEAYKNGDIHYWGVWWGYEPFEIYKDKVGRFVSEFGFQGMPNVKTIEYLMQGEEANMDHPYIAQHQKHPRGRHTIEEYMKRDFYTPKNFEDYLYISQLLQSEGVGEGVKSHRLAMPYCMGTLFWQLNDCWPSISWSAIDFFKQPKAFYFSSKRLFQDVAPIISANNDKVNVYLSNLNNSNFKGSMILGVYSPKNQEIKIDTIEVENSSMINKIVHQFAIEKDMVYGVQLFDEESNYIGHYTYFDNKNIVYNKKDIEINIDYLAHEHAILVSSNRAVFGLWLKADNINIEDNWFHLFPNFTYKIGIKDKDIDGVDFVKNLKYKYLTSNKN